MKGSGVIFENSSLLEWETVSGAGLSSPTREEKRLPKNLLRKVANTLIFFSLIGFLISFYPLLRIESKPLVDRFKEKLSRLQERAKKDFKLSFLPDLPPKTKLEVPNTSFSIVIPKLELSSAVSVSVDSQKEVVYKRALKNTGVAHASISGFPGQDETIYLFGHSTNSILNIPRFNAVFYGLSKLEKGDEVILVYLGREYKYQVTEKKVVNPQQAGIVINKFEELVLQTCWPPGTTKQRLLVYADTARE